MAFVRDYSSESPSPVYEGFGLSFKSVVKAVTSPVKGVAKVGIEWGKKGVKVGQKATTIVLAPTRYIEGQSVKLLPKSIRRFTITPSTYGTQIANQPQKAIKQKFSVVKEVYHRPTYELTKKVLGADAAASIMPKWVNPEDVAIKPGTEAAAKFRAAQEVGTGVAMGVAGTVNPAIGVAYGVYVAAKTKREQDKAQALMDKAMAQERKYATFEAQREQALLDGDMVLVRTLDLKLARMRGEVKFTNAEIDEMAKANPDMEAPSDRKKKVALAIGAVGAAGVAALALT